MWPTVKICYNQRRSGRYVNRSALEAETSHENSHGKKVGFHFFFFLLIKQSNSHCTCYSSNKEIGISVSVTPVK